MILLKQKNYISQQLQDWAKKERMRRDWEREERENLIEHIEQQDRRASLDNINANAALAVADVGNYEDDNAKFRQSFRPKDANVDFNHKGGSEFTRNHDYEPGRTTEDIINSYKDIIKNNEEELQQYEKRLKKAERLKSILNKEPSYSWNAEPEKGVFALPLSSRAPRRWSKSPLTPEDIESFKEKIGRRTHYRNSRMNESITDDDSWKYSDIDKLSPYEKKIKRLKEHYEDKLGSINRFKESLAKYEKDGYGNNEFVINLKHDSFQRADGRHEEGHMQNFINRRLLANDPNTPKYSNGNVIQIPSIGEKNGKKYLNNLTAMLDNGAYDQEQRGGFFGKSSTFLNTPADTPTKIIRSMIENKEGHLSRTANERLNYLKVIKEEEDASHKGWINNYLDPTTTEEQWIDVGRSNKLAGDTYRARISDAGGSISRLHINSNININPHKLDVLENLENNMIERMAKEGKKSWDIVDRVNKFRKHHGREFGFIPSTANQDLYGKVDKILKRFKK